MGRAPGTLNKQPIDQRFWSKVHQGALDECWEWIGAKTADGYGYFVVTSFGKRAQHLAHRFSFNLHHGIIGEGQVVRHTCDNPPCCNPAHLVVGTQADNVRDMVKRGRRASTFGELNPRAKLTLEDVTKIREDSRPYAELANAYGVCHATVSHIKNGRSWL